jgi:hypothetical protein
MKSSVIEPGEIKRYRWLTDMFVGFLAEATERAIVALLPDCAREFVLGKAHGLYIKNGARLNATA